MAESLISFSSCIFFLSSSPNYLSYSSRSFCEIYWGCFEGVPYFRSKFFLMYGFILVKSKLNFTFFDRKSFLPDEMIVSCFWSIRTFGCFDVELIVLQHIRYRDSFDELLFRQLLVQSQWNLVLQLFRQAWVGQLLYHDRQVFLSFLSIFLPALGLSWSSFGFQPTDFAFVSFF